jgi:acetyltransferase-like isoleucine patch superfamily enzyme
MTIGRTLRNDWYPGIVPDNVVVDPTAYIGSSYSFARFRSELSVGATIGRGASLHGSILDVGPAGKITFEEYATISESVYILCDRKVKIGAYSLIAWNAVLMDNYRTRSGFQPCRNTDIGLAGPQRLPEHIPATARPILLGRNTWIGHEACVLPGVSIGDGSIVGARSVVAHDVPPFAVVAGNPARIVRQLPRREWPDN